MSKDLEKEYRALVKSEVPDLWARIEAGLDEKEVSYKSKEENTQINIKRFFNYKVWATVAAACVCVGLIIPVMRWRAGGMQESRSDTAAPPEMAANNTNFDDVSVSPQSVGNTMSSGGADAGFQDSDAASASDSMKSENNAVTAEGAVYDGGDAIEEAGAEAVYVFQTEVEIMNVDEGMDGSVVYTARVLSSENSDLKEDGEIRIVLSASVDNDVLLEKGGTYELTLCEDNAGEELTYSIVD